MCSRLCGFIIPFLTESFLRPCAFFENGKPIFFSTANEEGLLHVSAGLVRDARDSRGGQGQTVRLS